jgi:hypothetical protein
MEQELARESWELEHYREGELKEMVDIFIARGLERADAENVVGIMGQPKYHVRWV